MREVRVLILRAPGTNCDWETKVAFEALGAKADVVTFNSVLRRRSMIFDYDIMVIPGGFSYGDFVRAGAIWGKRMTARLGAEIREFVRDGRVLLGICNGFQVLLESGLLPGKYVGVALAANASARYECRWTVLRYVNRGRCKALSHVPRGALLRVPVGHAEGRVVVASERDLRELVDDDLVILRYCKPDGSFADGEYPWNPNGSVYDIAGLCSLDGNVIGMMPHPERAFFRWQYPDWTRGEDADGFGDGHLILKSVVEYVRRRL